MKKVEKLLLGMVIGFGMCMMLSMLTSCSANKYGCGHGAPKQSWSKMVKRINNGY